MKTLKILLVVVGLALIWGGCKYDFIVPEEVPPVVDPDDPNVEQVSFATQIVPIFSNCTACHKTGSRSPDLTPANAYASINVPKYINATTPEQSLIYTMPTPSGVHPKKYTQAQAALLLLWIQQGAKNN